MSAAKRIQAVIAIAAWGMFVALGGCSWKSAGPDKGDSADAGTVELEYCTLKVSACRNKCYKADLGVSCGLCCDRNGSACDRGEAYSFNACLDE